MSQDKNKKARKEPVIEIDYDNVDVARIVDEIKKKVGRQPGRGEEDGRDAPPGSRIPGAALERDKEPQRLRLRMRRLLLKVMSPFSPLIKLLILPVYEEQRQIFLALHNTNKRLDQLIAKRDRELERLQEYTKLLHNLCHNLVVEVSKLKIEEDMLKTKTQIMAKDFEFFGKRERALEKEVFK